MTLAWFDRWLRRASLPLLCAATGLMFAALVGVFIADWYLGRTR